MAVMRQNAEEIIRAVLAACDPTACVQKAVAALPPCLPGGRTLLLAVGKAAPVMAAAALATPGFSAERALVVTKYGHGHTADLEAVSQPTHGLRLIQAGHPVPDANSYAAAEEAIAMVNGLSAVDRVVLLLSGGGSALFEKTLLPAAEMEAVNRQLLCCGAEIAAVNTIRKRLSAVKGGRFAQLCAPAQVITIALSDVLGDDPAAIASGPAVPDPTTATDALRVIEQYGLQLSPQAMTLLAQETPKQLPNALVQVVGGMCIARRAAAKACAKLGYRTLLFTPALTGEAAQTGRFLAQLATKAAREGRRLAITAGGETVVTLGSKHGLGGRNQEAALAAAVCLRGVPNCCFFSLGTDGTDGPTDAAGGYADGGTAGQIARNSKAAAKEALRIHDAYHALQSCGSLLVTGPTGTNVNDVCCCLVDAGFPRDRYGQTGEKQRKSTIKH